jgi:hypothetical protein
MFVLLNEQLFSGNRSRAREIPREIKRTFRCHCCVRAGSGSGISHHELLREVMYTVLGAVKSAGNQLDATSASPMPLARVPRPMQGPPCQHVRRC